MLTPEQIAAYRDMAGKITDPINDFLLEDIARRISEAGQLTSTASYQIWRAQNLGLSQRQMKKELRKRLKVSHRELRKLLKQSAEVGYDFDIKHLPQVQAIPFHENTSLQQIVEAAVKLAQDDFTNITQTLGMVDPYGNALPLQDIYRSCTDFAFKQVITGATDYNTAIRRATKNLAEQGVRMIDYESGVHTSLEAAVRRNIMGGLGLMQEQISEHNHDELGADGWEISAHANSAPDHEPIQGKQYTDEEYQALNGSLVRRIGTLNCGHVAFPIIMGVSEPQYTPEQLAAFRADNEKGVTVDGRHYTGYEATQMQRKIERSIRVQKRRVLAAEASGDKESLQIAQVRLQRLRQEYSRFSNAAGLRTENERLHVVGFGRSEATRAVAGAKKRIESVGEAAATLNWHRIPVAGGQTNTKYRMLKEPKTVDQTVAMTNPGYKHGGAGYRQNCQRCVPAYVMRRRGFDVIARPATVNENGTLSWKDRLYTSWHRVFKGTNFLRCTGADRGKAEIIAKMAEWGDGSIAEVRVLWTNGEAHVFVAEQISGQVRFVDPQTGDIDCERYFTNVSNGGTMFARIDNLEPTELIEECIKNRGGKSW